jgi:Uma2 family endonuclease
MTTLEYFQTPETVLPRELAYGVLRVADAPSTSHQRVVRDLCLLLAPFVRDRQLGEVLLAPVDVLLDFDAALVVQPDLLFVSNARSYIVSDRVHGAPDLAVEVLPAPSVVEASPHPRIGRLEERVSWFAKYGVRECWLVSLAERQLVVLTLGPGGVIARKAFAPGSRIRSDVLPGLDLSLDVLGWSG